MPTYAYRCTNPECAHTFDVVAGFHDAPATECPVCGQPVRKVFSPVGVVFKGSGFYRNDSRGKDVGGDKASASSEKGSSDKSSSDKGSDTSSAGSSASSSSSSDKGSSSSSDKGSSSSSSSDKGTGSSSSSSSSASSSASSSKAS